MLPILLFSLDSLNSHAIQCDYRVKKDDLLTVLSIEWYGSSKYWKDIAEKNNISSLNLLKVGQCITLPRPRTLSQKEGSKKVYNYWLAKMNKKDSSSIESASPINTEEEPLPKIDPYGLKINLGTALSYLNYSETSGSRTFKINEMGLTIKATFSYLLSSRFELSANVFGTLIPYTLSKDPSDIGSSRFYGAIGRIGYKFFEPSRGSSVWLMLGGYTWGQLVSNQSEINTYGVSMLSGPQAYLVGRFYAPNRHAWFAYLKYASINTFTISPQNREIGGGVGYQISSSRNPKKWFLNVDASQTKFYNLIQRIPQGFELNTIELGITTEL